ncbi:ankyrin repeat domain-containing protein [Mucilaginibacter sp. cycad4]|uniref:ankyrin repeat domain-containing protein n=1 Tax=Mucilaginibacter sp. cycad4 TaxID=3342096 RepID=UPI002AAAFC06|nr:ankyrin repeat domain-containing protein [Mucilaginibacter gossypii]WPU99136.1 ankyrin repeat domain-containing protein [Mucilaginibacter gossypii]
MDIFEATRANHTNELETALINTDVNAVDSRGSTPLIIAAYYNHVEAAAVLLQAGANPDLPDAMGNTALMGACFKGYAQLSKMLLDEGAAVDAVNGNMATALTFAATFGHIELVRLLLDRGANPMIRDLTGKNPVDHARVQENDSCYEILAAAANDFIRETNTK